MFRLIDADELKAVYIPSDIEGFETMMVPVEVVLQNIDDMPTVDAVPVVRCKDCKHYQFSDNRAFGFPVKRCEWTGFEDVDDEDFCSRGERKDDNDE